MAEEKKEQTDRQHTSDIIIESIKIKKIDDDNAYSIVEIKKGDEGSDSEKGDIFISLSMTESIFNAGVQGILKFREPIESDTSTGDRFNFVGGELVEIIIESPDIKDSRKELTFCVDDAKKLGNEASEALGGPSGRADSGWLITFVSCENFYLNWAEIDVAKEEDYIGHIAKSGSTIGRAIDAVKSIVPGLAGLGLDLLPDLGGGSFDGKPGLVNQLAEKYFNPKATDYSFSSKKMEIENTHNSVWLKSHHIMYPWGKDVHHENLMSMVTDLTENAVTEDQRGVNYLFYADLDGWHFKSIRKMLADEAGSYVFGLLGNDPREYFITDMDVDPEKWNFGDPRIIAMNVMSEFNHLKMWKDGAYSAYYELIKPNYDDPYFEYIDFVSSHQKSGANYWGEREIISYSYHDDPWGDSGDGGRCEEFKLLPDSIDTNGSSVKSRRMYDENGLYGYFGSPYNSQNYSVTDKFGAMHSAGKYGPANDILWRNMFDQSDLSGETLYKIQKKIKKPIRDSGAIEKFVQMKNLKERWKVYKESICCESEELGAANNEFFAIIDGSRKISGNEGRGGIYEYSWKEVEFWPNEHVLESDENAEELTDENSPIKIVSVINGKHGTFNEEDSEEWTNPAFNLNELMNKTEGDDVFVGPGINAASEEFNNYPSGYQMMPVGGYFRATGDIEDDPCFIRGEGEETYHHGHIVVMKRMPYSFLNSIRPSALGDEEELEDFGDVPEDIYYFNLPNAHDGLCLCGSEATGP